LLLTDLLGDFFAPLLYGIESGATAQGYDLLISTAGRRGPHDSLPRTLGAHNTDGLLVFAGSLTANGIRHAYSTGLPIVLIHQTPPVDVPLPCVTIENKAAARAIVEHLIEVHGCRRIVLLRGLKNNEDAFWREAGYREALAAHQLALDPRLSVPGDFERSMAVVSVTRLLEERIEFDAIFTGDDEAAVGAYSALQQAGKRVPDDAAVVGFDDQRLANVLQPPLTTVRAPTEQVGRVAAEQLIALIRTGQAEPLTLLNGELVIRQSCGCFVP
jgi:DNA-binding LacI/PurR family transcriptional regulator